MDVRAARVDQLWTVLDVLSDATTWLHGRGIEQWPERFGPDTVLPPLERGETWLASHRQGEEPFGTVTVQWVDDLIWPEGPGDAGHVYRLAVRRAAAGSGHGLLAWAEAHIAAAGRSRARLDCWAGNARLRRYCEDIGYRPAGERSEATWVVARYEKPLRG